MDSTTSEKVKLVKYIQCNCKSTNCLGKVYFDYESEPIPALIAEDENPQGVEGIIVYLTCGNADTQHTNQYFFKTKI